MLSILRFIVELLFRFRGYNTKVLKTPGPVLLIPNHVSWLDWLFLGVCLDSDWRFVVSSVVAEKSFIHRFIMVNRRTFPIDTSSPYAVKRMAEHLQKNGRLVLFAEGRISRTGSLMKLFDGTGFLIAKTGAKVITAYLRGAYHLPYSPNPAKRKLFPQVTAHFSEVLTAPKTDFESAAQTRAFLTNWLRERMVQQQFEIEMKFGAKTVQDAVFASAKIQPGKIVLEDVSRTRLSYCKTLIAANVLGGAVDKVLDAKQGRVGVLLPNVNALPILLLGLWNHDKVPAILNFSTGPVVMLKCTELAGLKQIITSRLFLEKARINIEPLTSAGISFLYLEDIRASIGSMQKLTAAIDIGFKLIFKQPEQELLSVRTTDSKSDDTAVILFTSGSEGIPKGVKLSHQNLLANMRQMLAVTDIKDDDRMFNCLPLFHSFGLTVGTLLPLMRGVYCFIYASPLHYRMIPAAFYDTDCTILLSTNTFLNGYARKANAYDFRTLRYLFAAAEKLQETTETTWAKKFGVRILEGYGATECSPCVSVNTPLRPVPGSVGHLMPGMKYRLEPVEGVEDGGRLFVRGPNIMTGYLNEDANAEFLALDGWYDTGDIVKVDADGAFFIRGRMKRFAKVSGEMVSLTAVEDALAGAFPQFGLRCQIAIVTRHDENKGEALIAVTNEPQLTMEQIRGAIKAKGLSNLCVPREIKAVKAIPKLGTGKTNYRELEQVIADTK